MDEDTFGCVIFALVLLGGGYWFYTHYEITKRREDVPKVAISTPAFIPARPTGIIRLGSEKDGSIWKVDADSVRGPRKARQGWVIIDASKDKTASYSEGRYLYQVDCETTASRDLSTATYDRKGINLIARSVEPDKAPVEYYPPNTFGGHVVSFLCDSKFDTPKTTGK